MNRAVYTLLLIMIGTLCTTPSWSSVGFSEEDHSVVTNSSNDDESAVLDVVSPKARVTQSKFHTLMRPEPDSFQVVTKIPPGSKVQIIAKTEIQEGMVKANWYRVNYDGKNGWVRGTDFEDGQSETKLSLKHRNPHVMPRKGLAI